MPDRIDDRAYLLFTYFWEDMWDVYEAASKGGATCYAGNTKSCADLRPHFPAPPNRNLGGLRCQFVDRDGRVMDLPISPVTAYSTML